MPELPDINFYVEKLGQQICGQRLDDWPGTL